jgi:hypothetical protein
MDRNACWYCNKELQEPITTYKRKHRRSKYRTDISVHSACYKSLNRARKRYRPIAPGTITQ